MKTPDAESEAPALISTRKPRDEERIRNTIPVPTSAREPPTMTSFIPVDIPQSSKVGQQRQQISELQFDKIPLPSSFVCWKIRFNNQVTTCSDFPSEAMLWIKEVEMGDSMDELKSSRSTARKDFPNFELLDSRIASALQKIIQNSHFKKKVSLEEQKAQKRRLVSTTKTDRLHDLRLFLRVTGAHDTVLDYGGLLINHSSQRRGSGIRYQMGWTLLRQRFLPMTSWKDCTN